MTGTDILIIAAGLAAIALVNWYFFVAGRKPANAAARPDGSAEVTIVVKGGYEPATSRIPAGVPVTLVFDRQETSSCSEEVVIPDLGVRRFLPANQRTSVTVTVPRPGRYEFTCGMGMLHGALVAEARS